MSEQTLYNNFLEASKIGNVSLLTTLSNQHKHTVQFNYDMALSYACQYGHVEVVKFLVDRCSHLDKYHWTPIILDAYEGGNEEILNILRNKAPWHYDYVQSVYSPHLDKKSQNNTI